MSFFYRFEKNENPPGRHDDRVDDVDLVPRHVGGPSQWLERRPKHRDSHSTTFQNFYQNTYFTDTF